MNIEVNGPMKLFAIETPLGDIVVTQTVATLVAVSILLIVVSFFISRSLTWQRSSASTRQKMRNEKNGLPNFS